MMRFNNIELSGDVSLYNKVISAVYSAEFDSNFKVYVGHVYHGFILQSFKDLLFNVKKGLKVHDNLKKAIDGSATITLNIEYIQDPNAYSQNEELAYMGLLHKKYEIIRKLASYSPNGLNDLKRAYMRTYSIESELALNLMNSLQQQDNICVSGSGLAKAVHQYDKETGTYIKTFYSVTEASKETGASVSAISCCCIQKLKSSMGFIWSYDKADNIFDKNPFYIRRIKDQPVYVYDLETFKLIGSFKSLNEASRESGVAKYSIVACCKGISKTAGGYFWSYKELPIGMEKYIIGEAISRTPSTTYAADMADTDETDNFYEEED